MSTFLQNMATTTNLLFEMVIRVRRGPDCAMPSHLIGAHVPCYVAAPDHLSAVRLAVNALGADGYVFDDLVDQSVYQLEPSVWEAHVQQMWGDLPNALSTFPDESVIRQMLASNDGGVVFGPFACWERED